MSQDLSVAKRIEQRLESLGYWRDGRPDLKRVSSESAMPASTLRRWLAGTMPSVPNSLMLADFLGVRIEWLLFGEGPEDGLPRLPRPRLVLAPDEWNRVRIQAVAEYPKECCGVVLILATEPTRRLLLPCRNVQDLLHASDPARHPRDARTAFSIDSLDLEKIGRHMEDGYRVGTIYHSHPESAAHFSRTDKAQALTNGKPAYPEAFQVVVSVRKLFWVPRVTEVGAYAWDAKEKDFLSVWPRTSATRQLKDALVAKVRDTIKAMWPTVNPRGPKGK
jgi:proteasome lid subunit RPN8/RPN11